MDNSIKYNNDILTQYYYCKIEKLKDLEITNVYYYKDYISIFTVITKGRRVPYGDIRTIYYTDIDTTLRLNKINKIKSKINKWKITKWINYQVKI